MDRYRGHTRRRATAVRGVFQEGVTLLDRSGIVIAGYGQDEYFPSSIVYECVGIVLGKALFYERERKCISHGDASQVMPIAQSEMAQTFIYGMSGDALVEVDKVFAKSLVRGPSRCNKSSFRPWS